ncbi:polysaccharide deacetylase family protein [Duganella vulcania]|uniref:Polysaccharide deacetylase family protein n=1 Tax=Duganella vulcania TaxID=2692166 RepID=A0A845GX65_9BURK|nr:polysaccharide deacetylase family protein [Duganella vulcania]MYM97766.1 polysaccharide deacetylase family protein [Duganella vulcania]
MMMQRVWRAIRWLALFWPLFSSAGTCSILVYHHFGPTAADSMTTTTAVFAAQIAQLRAHGYRIVPLSDLVAALAIRQQRAGNLVAITVDDGHRSVYSELYPLAQRENLPLTLFIYPSAIGRASYALDWEQLRTMQAGGNIEIGSHTQWHPNFRHERARLSAADYQRFVTMQLTRPRDLLRQQLHVEARYLAWPFGIVDAELEAQAHEAGYSSAFALGNRNATSTDSSFALPRHLIVDAVGVKGMLARLAHGPQCAP